MVLTTGSTRLLASHNPYGDKNMSKFVLVYYGAFATADLHDGPAADVPEVKAFAATLRDQTPGCAVLIRSAEAFDGTVETLDDEYPRGVVLLAHGPSLDVVREAYETVGVEVSEGETCLEDAVENARRNDEGGDPFGGDAEKLKARATELGINFAQNIGYKTLLGRVVAAMAETNNDGGE